jgi:molybdopterin/thiamine biosynthesis adenylyltransferase
MSDSTLTSAIKRRASPRPTLLVFEISAKIAKADIEAMAKQIDAAFDAHDKVDIREALGAQARSIRHVRKYAVVGAPAWARAMIEVSDFLSPVDAKTFDLAEEAEAWAWIEAGSAP